MQSNASQPQPQPPPQKAPPPSKRSKAPPASAKEAVAALRAELQVELQNKKQCAYRIYECPQFTMDGYNYCPRHIMEDKTAPFRQCSYVYTNSGKRCHLPAPRGDKKEQAFRMLYPRKHLSRFCSEHALKFTMQKNRQNSRYPPPQTAEVLLTSLSHYIKKPKTRTVSSSTAQQSDEGRSTPDEADGPRTIKPLDPFVDIDAVAVQHSACTDVLDMCSESDSDIEASTFASVWHDAQADTSDDESVDSEQEDALKHANVYTAEEITSVARDKLIRLQSLYLEQYKHLQHMLKEHRRKYLVALKKEKENYCSVSNQVRSSPKDQRLYKKLKAYNSYHKKHGVEAILNKRVHNLRMKITEGVVPKQPSYTKCSFSEGGIKCGERALPVARHCRKHILEDSNQVLFKPCGKVCGDIECTTPVEAIFENSTCRLHMEIPPIRSYNLIRKDSESDYDDTTENFSNSHSLAMPNVKTELIDYSLPATVPDIEKIPSVFGKSFPFEDDEKDGVIDGRILKTELDIKTEEEEQVVQEEEEASMHNVEEEKKQEEVAEDVKTENNDNV